MTNPLGCRYFFAGTAGTAGTTFEINNLQPGQIFIAAGTAGTNFWPFIGSGRNARRFSPQSADKFHHSGAQNKGCISCQTHQPKSRAVAASHWGTSSQRHASQCRRLRRGRSPATPPYGCGMPCLNAGLTATPQRLLPNPRPSTGDSGSSRHYLHQEQCHRLHSARTQTGTGTGTEALARPAAALQSPLTRMHGSKPADVGQPSTADAGA